VKNLTLTETRNRLLHIAQEIEDHPDTVVEVRKHGKPVITLLSAEFYETLVETLEILGDESQAARLRQALHEIEKGQGIPWKTAKRRLGLEG
jgi:prevent-host-death family protein